MTLLPADQVSGSTPEGSDHYAQAHLPFGFELAGNLHQFCAALKIETWKLPQIEPMMLSRVAAPFDHPDFLFELKQDGFRCIAYISESGCDLVSRCKYSYKSFDSLKTALAKLKARDAILDGEICCLEFSRPEGESCPHFVLLR